MSNLVPFRAGNLPGEQRAVAQAMPPDFGSSVVLLADVSEFQPDISDPVYLNWSKAIVIRAAYGDTHDDRAWYGGQRRALLLEGGARFLGIYQYVVAGEDIVAQAKAFVSLLGGKLNKGELPIADIEEGQGSQQQRWVTWADAVAQGLGFDPWDYSGENFAATNGLSPVDWVAAYVTAEPSVQHKMWQFSSSYQVPGVGTADCSVFHGTIDDLAALAYGGGSQPAPAPTPAAPPFPYPASDYLGMQSTDPHCHSGFNTADQGHVRTWQGQMAHRGWALAVDGSYGLRSQTVCEGFQQEKGLAVDGKVGPVTWRASWADAVT